MRCQILRTLSIAAMLMGLAPGMAPAAVLFSEGSFQAWTTYAAQAPGAGSTQTFLVSSTGGNPGGMLTAYSTRADAGQVMSAHIKEDLYTLSALSGTITLNFDFQRAAGATSGIYGTGFAMRQGSKYWYSGDNSVGDATTWTNSVSASRTVTGNFASVNPMYGTTGSPVLTGGVPTYFGLFTYLNGPSGGVWGSSFDNIVLATPSSSIVMVPEPATFALLGLGLMGPLTRRRRTI